MLPSFPNDNASVNSAFLHCDLKGRPYRIQDFRSELERCGVLKEVVAFMSFQRNHLWTRFLWARSPPTRGTTLCSLCCLNHEKGHYSPASEMFSRNVSTRIQVVSAGILFGVFACSLVNRPQTFGPSCCTATRFTDVECGV